MRLLKKQELVARDHELKIERVDGLTKGVADSIVIVMQEFLEQFSAQREPSPMDCRSRDGFIPNSDNMGGLELTMFSTLGFCEGSGYFPGSDKARLIMEKYIEEARKGYPSEMTDKQHDEYVEGLNDDYSSICTEIQLQYHGMERGIHSVTLRVPLCVSDAPYHRKADDVLEFEIKFRTVRSFKVKLMKLTKKVESFINTDVDWF